MNLRGLLDLLYEGLEGYVQGPTIIFEGLHHDLDKGLQF